MPNAASETGESETVCCLLRHGSGSRERASVMGASPCVGVSSPTTQYQVTLMKSLAALRLGLNQGHLVMSAA